jgi:CheY-like chemotaxis protein
MGGGTTMGESPKKRILVAEDNHNDIFLLKSAFQEAAPDICVSFFEQGTELVNHLESRQQTPAAELLLLDLNIPGLDGFGVLEWIRRQPGLRKMPVIVFSSSGAAADIDQAYELGANSYLVKPFDFRQLTEMVRRIVGYWLEINQSPDCMVEQPVRG